MPAGVYGNDDEILVPAPDYPLWTAAVTLTGGKPVHYLCDEAEHWWPDMADVEAKITSRPKGIVIINPNNPTGAAYPRLILEQFATLARKHHLVLFSDEIYENVLYEDAQHIHTASVAEDVCCLTFSGLSKAYRMPGYRAGWVAVTGPLAATAAYREGLELLASLYKLLTAIPGVTCVPAAGAMYLFPRLDPGLYLIRSDEQFVLDLLQDQKILVSHGSAFNWPAPDHFRFVILPSVLDIEEAVRRISAFLATYRSSVAD